MSRPPPRRDGAAVTVLRDLREIVKGRRRHPGIAAGARGGQTNAITDQGVQAVKTGEMTAGEAAEFVVEEPEVELGDAVIILD